ncbi:MAG: nuclear transport factor 2 family protein [Pseudomonadota bacterium]
MDEKKLQLLLDRTEIIDVVIRYATSIGLHDWAGLRSCYTDQVEIDYTSMIGGNPIVFKADDWVTWARENASGFESVMHYTSNDVVTINGDEATCMSYVHSEFYLPNDKVDSMWSGGGYYTNGMIRTSEGWKINKTKLTVKWSKGSQELFAIAKERYASSGKA